jgi:phosphoribosylformylglycinamidine synthase subunit PurQ / glutaminase
MKSAVIVFPGSNCDRDAQTVLKSVCGSEAHMVWHRDTSLPKVDVVVVPGGFSYGDYLRSGAMAAQSPIMREVIQHANAGGKVIGICNGFQVLTESGLLPGVLMRNRKLKFLCREVFLTVENNQTPYTNQYSKGQVINVPIAHHDGNYFASPDMLKSIEDNGQVVFRYCAADGAITDEANPNGSVANIAGVCNEKGNVLGMMPHPERHAESLLGGEDGVLLFKSLMAA